MPERMCGNVSKIRLTVLAVAQVAAVSSREVKMGTDLKDTLLTQGFARRAPRRNNQHQDDQD
jgi:hypothetical protein